ncbi:winged helix-turn-helix transcriptional regulator [Limosilactobacillus sp.]|uniref:winged helix-turn-helix transcriptional regulator n=1 Tax=Limosilactobacillus sp. TaxID=2773925 RepID=UPI003F0BAF12
MEQRKYFLGCNYIISIVDGKWKPSIICSLGLGAKRFGELRHYLEKLYGITPAEKVLSEQLHQLIADRVVRRTDYGVMPPKVVYSLTDRGVRLKKLLIQMTEFAEQIQDDSVSFMYGSDEMKGISRPNHK